MIMWWIYYSKLPYEHWIEGKTYIYLIAMIKQYILELIFYLTMTLGTKIITRTARAAFEDDGSNP